MSFMSLPLLLKSLLSSVPGTYPEIVQWLESLLSESLVIGTTERCVDRTLRSECWRPSHSCRRHEQSFHRNRLTGTQQDANNSIGDALHIGQPSKPTALSF